MKSVKSIRLSPVRLRLLRITVPSPAPGRHFRDLFPDCRQPVTQDPEQCVLFLRKRRYKLITKVKNLFPMYKSIFYYF